MELTILSNFVACATCCFVGLEADFVVGFASVLGEALEAPFPLYSTSVIVIPNAFSCATVSSALFAFIYYV